MKDKIKTTLKIPATKILIFSIVWNMILIPLLSEFHILDKTLRISVVFLILNIIISAVLGNKIRTSRLNKYTVFLFPCVFIIQVAIRYGKYGYLLALIYLLISILSYILTKEKNH